MSTKIKSKVLNAEEFKNTSISSNCLFGTAFLSKLINRVKSVFNNIFHPGKSYFLTNKRYDDNGRLQKVKYYVLNEAQYKQLKESCEENLAGGYELNVNKLGFATLRETSADSIDNFRDALKKINTDIKENNDLQMQTININDFFETLKVRNSLGQKVIPLKKLEREIENKQLEVTKAISAKNRLKEIEKELENNQNIVNEYEKYKEMSSSLEFISNKIQTAAKEKEKLENKVKKLKEKQKKLQLSDEIDENIRNRKALKDIADTDQEKSEIQLQITALEEQKNLRENISAIIKQKTKEISDKQESIRDLQKSQSDFQKSQSDFQKKQPSQKIEDLEPVSRNKIEELGKEKTGLQKLLEEIKNNFYKSDSSKFLPPSR